MNRVFFILFLLFSFAICYAGSENDYPEQVLRLRLQKQYDNAKWVLYCIHSDEVVQFKGKIAYTRQPTFGELPLKFDYLELKSDTVELNFVFTYKNIELDSRTVSNKLIYGAVFKDHSDRLIYYHAGGEEGYFFWHCKDLNDCPNRFGKPLQPEVIKYIKEHKDKLDPWFRKEAIKRGVINE